jgi:hypothetical protein
MQKRKKFGDKIFTHKWNWYDLNDARKDREVWKKKGYQVQIVKDKMKGNSQGFKAGDPIYRVYVRRKYQKK